MIVRPDRRTAIARTAIVIVIIIVVAVAGIGVYALSSSSSSTTSASSASTTAQSSSQTSAANQTLVVDYTSNPGSLDPRASVEISGHGIYNNIYQPLLYYNDSSTTQIVPILASSYTASPNGSVYTFSLRSGIKFSNGDAFNAYDVWYTFYSANIMNQAAAVDYAQFVNLAGVTASQLNGHFTSASNIPDAATVAFAATTSGIKVVDASTVVFHLISAAPDFVAFMTSLYIVSAHYVDSNGGVLAGQPSTYMTLNPMGTGAFTMSQWVQNQQVILVRNPTYWGGVGNVFPTPKLSKVVIRFVSDVTVRLNDLQSGVAQAAVTDWNHLTSVPGVSLPNIGVSQTFVMIPLNTQKAPTNNLLVREAISHALNFTAIDQGVYHGYISPCMGPISCGSSIGHDSALQQYAYNLTLAAQLLSQAGFPGGKGAAPINFVWATDYPEGQPMGQIIQSELSQIGLTVSLTGTSFANEINLFALPNNSTQAPNMGWLSCTWLPVPSACPSILIPGNAPINWAHYNDTQVNSLWTQALFQLNATLRQQEYNQIAQIEYTNVNWLWIGQYLDAFPAFPILFANSVHGLYYNSAFSEVDFSGVYLTS